MTTEYKIEQFLRAYFEQFADGHGLEDFDLEELSRCIAFQAKHDAGWIAGDWRRETEGAGATQLLNHINQPA